MSISQPFISTVTGTRQFACSAVAIQAVVVSPEEKILMLSSPRRNPDGAWQVVSGALEAEETILNGALREAHEELGVDIRVRPLGTIHVQTFQYDEKVRYTIAVYYLLAYEGGVVRPGDDMGGSRYHWWSLTELADEEVKVVVPPNQKWLLKRAIELYQLWKDHAVELQLEQL